jgi:CxxC motif-containing protein (DUF1111 family)
VGEEAVALIADFVRFLVPIAQEVPATEASRDTLRWEEEVFEETGCGSCHVRTLITGPNTEPALDPEARGYLIRFLTSL